MLRSLSTAFLVTALVLGALLVAAMRPPTIEADTPGAPPSTDATTTAATTTPPATTVPTTEPTTTTTAATTTSTTSTTTEPTPTTIVTTSHDPPVRTLPPTNVAASDTMVGAGGQVGFVGACGETFTTVFVRVTGTTTVLVDTGLTGQTWTYTWTAPTDPGQFSSFTFEFWCGDPTGTALTYPVELRRRVDMVASLPPPPTSPASTSGRTSTPGAVTLPDTR